MAIKGPTYPKTTWQFQERPVASAKLNNWDDRIEAALELICLLLSASFGGQDGVLRTSAANGLQVTALDTPGLSVEVQPGDAFINGYPYRLISPLGSASVATPVSFARRDLVQARLLDWSIALKTGIEAGSPVAPEPDTDCIPLAELHLRPGMTSIQNTDDATNGYIIDARSFL